MFGGGPIDSFGCMGAEDGQFQSPREIAVADHLDRVYVVDKGNHRVEVGQPSVPWLYTCLPDSLGQMRDASSPNLFGDEHSNLNVRSSIPWTLHCIDAGFHTRR